MHYLHQLQTNFDYRKIKYTQEFYDLDLNPDVPQPAPEWKVTFEAASGAKAESGPGKSWLLAKNLTGLDIIGLSPPSTSVPKGWLWISACRWNRPKFRLSWKNGT